MTRMISFAILIAVILIMAALFVVLMAQFLLPMFLAVLLAVMFRPLYERILVKCHGHRHWAAGLSTLAIVLIVLLPVVVVLARAAMEGYAAASNIDQEKLRQTVVSQGGTLLEKAREYGRQFGFELPSEGELIRSAASEVQSWIAPAALRTTQFLGNAIVGLFILIVSLYFFLADGSALVDNTLRLAPLDSRYGDYVRQLVDAFDRVSRAVVLATLLGAIGQGLLAGVGYFIAGLNSIFLLTVATMLMGLVPFIGAAAVWLSCALWLYFVDGQTFWAGFLVLWGLGIVSMADNVIKPFVLHGQSHIHPLLALLSVLGGMTALGPIGIFVGPMVVAFLQSLLIILRTELESMEGDPAKSRAAARTVGSRHR